MVIIGFCLIFLVYQELLLASQNHGLTAIFQEASRRRKLCGRPVTTLVIDEYSESEPSQSGAGIPCIKEKALNTKVEKLLPLYYYCTLSDFSGCTPGMISGITKSSAFRTPL